MEKNLEVKVVESDYVYEMHYEIVDIDSLSFYERQKLISDMNRRSFCSDEDEINENEE